MTALWDTQALVAATGGRPLGKLPDTIGGISIDTRTLEPGDAFFAIKGDRFDGHNFATAAMAAGAGLMVVAEEKLPSLGRLSMPMIVVADVLKALEKVGAAARKRSKAKIIAVTGSAGKTTTKEMLRVALGAAGKVHAADKSFNNHWGVPLTLARLPADSDFAVFEIGMNHPGEIRPLVKLVRPHVAIITLIAPAHLGHFKSLEEIAQAKAEIFEGVEPGGHAVVNRDDPRWKLLEAAAKSAGIANIHGFGANARANFKLLSCDLAGDHSDFTARIAGKEVSGRIGAPGRHIVQNALAVLGTAKLAGADVAKAASALAGFTAERGRGKRHVLAHKDGEIVLIDESYNANPVSMKAALELLASAPKGEKARRIAVLGDMLELGQHSAKFHTALAQNVVAAEPDIVLLAGKETAALAAALPPAISSEYREDTDALKPLLLKMLKGGDTVMIKSSNGVGFSRLVEAVTDKFPAAQVRR
ncbi:MAG: UDP-N-acetylmuramoylalanyl-D-glutamyl-2,6-diaminopimelate--D-alanyl-D-alanine ligase [Brucellaceae bacterium]|nr:UDP-N-acetylmuramoylalanyl-D-glutamyl-2,6-diaminopimelate--D-alanyl-D-alanine ligase [Brucellaceae bacterium]